MNNDYKTIGLYEHNAESYSKVNESFKDENIVGIVHATGTGKSYNALQLAFDNKDKKLLQTLRKPRKSLTKQGKKAIYVYRRLRRTKNIDFVKRRSSE